jgi:mannose-6-phosphate isomerase
LEIFPFKTPFVKLSQATSIFPLQGSVQHYDWGGTQFIPGLLNIPNSKKEPYAELWMGAHPRGPAQVSLNGASISLGQLIARNPAAYLGKSVSRRFDKKLPFLLKVLDVHKMLSIQAHPAKREAETGYRQENERGIPLDAPQRIFKDDNHKPEVMVALTDFWLLHGFRPAGEIEKMLRQMKEWDSLMIAFSRSDTSSLYRHIMELPQEQVDRLLHPLAVRFRPAIMEGKLTKAQPEYWAVRAFEDFTSPDGHYDRGIFSIFLFNLVHLKKDEGIFQEAGIPHAYLEGVNVELMANSDNVFRGGLTRKHVDVGVLMKHLVFDPVEPVILRGHQISATERTFPTPAPDFQLSRIEAAPGTPHREVTTTTPQIFLVLEGSIRINNGRRFQRGSSFFVKPGAAFHIRSEEEAVLFKATVPA